MTEYIPLRQSIYNKETKILTLVGGYIEVNGKDDPVDIRTTVFYDVERNLDGSYTIPEKSDLIHKPIIDKNSFSLRHPNYNTMEVLVFGSIVSAGLIKMIYEYFSK